MIENELRKNCRFLRINPAETIIVVKVLTRDLRINDRLIVGLMLWQYFIARVFVFWFMFFAMGFFVNLEIETSF